MRARGDQNRDIFHCEPGALQPLQQRRQRYWVRRGPCDVANGDGGRSLACGEFKQRLRSDGAVERIL
jgi:hypothetical protein